jgi:hypothetical protein
MRQMKYVIGGFNKLYTEELDEMRKECKILVRKLKERDGLEDAGVDGLQYIDRY